MTRCNPCAETPCPHCDRPCNLLGCGQCTSTRHGTNVAVAQLSRTPIPSPAVLHDMATTCGTCGGPTFETGPDQPRWCPTPFCP